MQFNHAILRTPGSNFQKGITTSNLGNPDIRLTLQQHADYCKALELCGVELTILDSEQSYPDSTFVEDTAVLIPSAAILTNPGAESRKGEVALIEPVLKCFFQQFYKIKLPGTLEGGDICQAGNHFFIGISDRTNPEGAHQLSDILKIHGYSSGFIDIRNIQGLLHLKSGLAFLGGKTILVIKELINHPGFADWPVISTKVEENYAVNCIQVNNSVLIASGFPNTKRIFEDLGKKVITLEMSEFQKMDGGLSCLSLRF